MCREEYGRAWRDHDLRRAAQFLYSDPGQEILAKGFNRVRSPAIAARYKAQLPDIKLLTVDSRFGGWANVTRVHFANGGVLDQILASNNK